MTEAGLIFDIQRHSLHDGPGIRTLVFLKGCPLHCPWCCNPESQVFAPEVFFHPERCIGCFKCAQVCPRGASFLAGERIRFERTACQVCGACVEACYAEARVLKGRWISLETVLKEILRDQPFYARSGGGVTLGGGEPLHQDRFAAALLKACRKKGIHTALETAGYSPRPNLERLMDDVDLFLYDLKHTDPEKHQRFTRVDLTVILDNLRMLVQAGRSVIVRTPVIPGFNDTSQELEAIIRKADEVGVREIHFLPYHRFGKAKYGLLGRPYLFEEGNGQGRDLLEAARKAAEQQGLTVRVGG